MAEKAAQFEGGGSHETSPETSKQSFVSNASLEEGPEHEFVPPLDSKYECPICLCCLRDPVQTTCGHRFCKKCIYKWLKDSRTNRRCPVCNEVLSEENIFADNFAKREILALNIRCPNRSKIKGEEGCPAIIELRELDDHLKSSCLFKLEVCPNQCSGIFFRKDVLNHTLYDCPNRKTRCDFCMHDITVSNKKSHLSTCPLVPTKCKFCDIVLTREQLQRHISHDCPKSMGKCPFYAAGCQTELARADIQKHMEQSTQEHIQLLCSTVNKMARILNLSPATNKTAPSPDDETCTSMFVAGSDSFVLCDVGEQLANLNLGQGYSTLNVPVMGMEGRLGDGILPLASVKMPPPGTHHGSLDTHSGLHQREQPESIHVQEFQTLQERNVYQDEKIAKQEQKVLELQAKNMSIERKLEEYKTRTKVLEGKISEMEARNCNGIFHWVINNYSRLRSEAQLGETTVLHSPGFYTSFYGYKICIRLNLNGVETAHGTHLSIFIHFMQGEFDDLLDWPFNGRITLSILDQNDQTDMRQHITETLMAKPHLAAFQRPRTTRNHKGFGYMEFAPLSLIENAPYVKNDTLIIRAAVVAQATAIH